jgi:DNA processing protein
VTDEHYARAALTYLAEPADTILTTLVPTYGPVRVLAMIKAGHPPEGITAGAQRWRARLRELPSPADLARLTEAGIRVICPGDSEWPQQLADLGDDEPIALWLRGAADLASCLRRSVSITGSRAATAYGSHVATDIAATLAQNGRTVVSGGAYGIDAAAHRGALAVGGVTVAVLAGGVDRPYPAGHAGMLETIAADGVVISEWPPGCNATRLRFVARNRLIAALAQATVLVEAANRSGSLNTARHATSLRRSLMAIPGPITSGQSAGTNALIRDGRARLITSASDILDDLSVLGRDQATP